MNVKYIRMVKELRFVNKNIDMKVYFVMEKNMVLEKLLMLINNIMKENLKMDSMMDMVNIIGMMVVIIKENG